MGIQGSLILGLTLLSGITSQASVEPELIHTYQVDLPSESSLTPKNFPYLFGKPLVFKKSSKDERLAVVTSEGTVYVVAPHASLFEKKFETHAKFFNSPALRLEPSGKATLVLASENGSVLYLDPETGQSEAYAIDPSKEGRISASPTVSSSGEVLVSTLNGSLFFFGSHLEVLKKVSLGSGIYSEPALFKSADGEEFALFSAEAGELIEVSLLTRSITARYSLSGELRSSPVVTKNSSGKLLIVATTLSGWILVLDRSSGALLSQVSFQGETGLAAGDLLITLTLASDGKVYGAGLRALFQMDPNDLSGIHWAAGEAPAFSFPFSHSSGRLIVGSDMHGVHFRNADLSVLKKWISSDLPSFYLGGDPYQWISFLKNPEDSEQWFFGQETNGFGNFFYIVPHGPDPSARAVPYPVGAYSQFSELSNGEVVVSRVDGKILSFKLPPL